MIYFVGTPIGNLKDITLRAIEVLKNVSYIACEDTRTSSVLLKHYDIHTKVIAYHKFNEQQASAKIVQDAKQMDIAVISDAGLPVISDPGSVLVQKLQENQIPYTVIAGPSACTNAFILSGMETPFTFIGFLPEKNKERVALIEQFKRVQTTLLFYVSPHDIDKDIEDLYKVLGDRKIAVVREITKLFEEVVHSTLEKGYNGVKKGEFVVVVDKPHEDTMTNEQIANMLKEYLSKGYSKTDAIKMVVQDTNLKKNDVYQIALHL